MSLHGRCTACGIEIHASPSGWSPCRCRIVTGVVGPQAPNTKGGPGAGARRTPTTPTKPWSNARKTQCGGGHTHASKMEARVCDRLRVAYPGAQYRLVQQIRLPLLVLVDTDGRVPYMTVDFGVLNENYALVRLVDAKTKRRVSRDWPARKRALENSWDIKIEEVER